MMSPFTGSILALAIARHLHGRHVTAWTNSRHLHGTRRCGTHDWSYSRNLHGIVGGIRNRGTLNYEIPSNHELPSGGQDSQLGRFHVLRPKRLGLLHCDESENLIPINYNLGMATHQEVKDAD